MQSTDLKPNSAAGIGGEYSSKLRFLLSKLPQIIELEKELRHVLSEVEIKKNHLLLVKLFEGGWILARDIFAIQKVFKEEKTFFQALCFIKRIEVSQFDQPVSGSRAE